MAGTVAWRRMASGPDAGRLLCAALLTLAVLAAAVEAKTRWSSLQLVPDADLLGGGQFVVSVPAYYSVDSASHPSFRAAALFTLGIVEWVNIQAGYAGGVTLGFKARILGETKTFVPSLAIGAHNLFYHKEAFLFGTDDADLKGEYYLALGKTVEQIKTRFHIGVQTIPTENHEVFNPYLAIEKFFGKGLYVNVEIHRRDLRFHPSLFVAYRFLSDKVEIAAGAVSLVDMFYNKRDKFTFYLSEPAGGAFVRPGFWFGLRYFGSFGRGELGGLAGLEEQVVQQRTATQSLGNDMVEVRRSIDSIRTALSALSATSAAWQDSAGGTGRFKDVIVGKFVALKTLYNATPFDPEAVKNAQREIVGFRERAVPSLKEIVLDKREDRFHRIMAISVLGEMRAKGAVDALLETMSDSDDPDFKIEILIALGKLKETRAVYMIEQLANDPNDATAYTAQEVLHRFETEDGVQLSPGLKMRPVNGSDSLQINDRSLVQEEEDRAGAANGKPGAGDTPAPARPPAGTAEKPARKPR